MVKYIIIRLKCILTQNCNNLINTSLYVISMHSKEHISLSFFPIVFFSVSFLAIYLSIYLVL